MQVCVHDLYIYMYMYMCYGCKVIHVHDYWQASDAQSTGRVLKAIVQMCFDMQEWDLLNEHILLLTKKRGQLKTVTLIPLW